MPLMLDVDGGLAFLSLDLAMCIPRRIPDPQIFLKKQVMAPGFDVAPPSMLKATMYSPGSEQW